MMRTGPFWRSLTGTLGVVSLPLVILAQRQVDLGGATLTPWLIFAVGTVLFLAAFVDRRVAPQPAECGSSDRPWGVRVGIVGAGASLASYAFLGDNRLTWPGIVLWQGGLFLFIAGVAGWYGPWQVLSGLVRRWRSFSLDLGPATVLVSLLTLLGAAFRFWRIASLPAEPGVDLPLILLNVEKVLNGEWPIFFTLHPGREGLYMYLAAGYVKIFGLSYPVLRSVSALIGTATIPVIYRIGRQLFDWDVGLLAAALLAVSRWHIILSRTGLRFVLMPLFGLLLLGALVRALKSYRPFDWVMVGCWLGWGMHTYNAWLVMPALVVGGWLWQRWVARDWSWRGLLLLLLALAVACLLVVPLVRFAHDDPVILSMRVVSRISAAERPLPGDLLATAWNNIWRTLNMFNVTGDGVAHINVPLKRQLGLVSAALFVPGIAYLCCHWRRYGVLLLGIVISCLPSALSLAFPEEVPNAGRASGVIGFVCLTAAVPLALWYRQLRHLPPSRPGWRPLRVLARVILSLLLVGLLAGEGLETRTDYFERYPFYLAGGNYPLSTQLVETIQHFSPTGKVYLKIYPYWYDGNAVRTQLRLAGVDWENEISKLPEDVHELAQVGGPTVFILHPDDLVAQDVLLAAFPGASVFFHSDNHGRPAFMTVVIAG